VIIVTKRTKILGRAGCGKTHTALKKVIEFIDSCSYKIDDITMTTFRKSAAEDIIDAVMRAFPLIDGSELRKNVGTIHSQCYRLIGAPDLLTAKDYSNFLQEYPTYALYATVTDRDVKRDVDIDNYNEVASADLFDLYAWCKNTMTPPQDCWKYPSFDQMSIPHEKVPMFFTQFEDYKRFKQRIDFTDMLQRVIDEKIMLGTKVLVVDEFQDLTPQMYAIFKMWEKDSEHVIIAGDPYQSIYGVFGGSPDFFNEWEADEDIVLRYSHRLPQHVNALSYEVLKMDGMYPPPIWAKYGCGDCITAMHYTEEYPVYATELHLVRANYQIPGVMLRLAQDGKLFSTINPRNEGWTSTEIDLANAIISLKTGKELTMTHIKAIVEYFPVEMLDLPCGDYLSDELNKKKDTKKKRELNKTKKELVENGYYVANVHNGVAKVEIWHPSPEIMNILKSPEPTQGMNKENNNLFVAKINGVKDRKELIEYSEAANRRVMTIHGAKGLESLAVFLHTSITRKIKQAIIKDVKESQAEARVWYVGCTRAIEHLYLVQDEKNNYDIPTIPPAPIEIDLTGIDLFADDGVVVYGADWD
jgi:DNA helicase II / ATP-dependent DNA helicase PcrA